MSIPTAYLRSDIEAAWQGEDPLQAAFKLNGEVFRQVATRTTMRVQIEGKHFFVKLHYGVGWLEVLKNWLQLKRPVIGADNEYEICQALASLGITAPIPAAFAMGPGSIAHRRSFVLCDELQGYMSLEDVTDTWAQHPPTPMQRHRLLVGVARFARGFHQAGFVHRDFYHCHLWLNQEAWSRNQVELGVLDLHRARQFAQLPDAWRARDLAALLFSTLDFDFSQRQWLRFIRIYSQRPLRQELEERGAFWQRVRRRAEKLYREGHRKGVVSGHYLRGTA